MFSDKTYQLLIKAGWQEGRKVQINNEIEFLQKSNFNLSKLIKDFLGEFCGLCIKHPHRHKPENIDYFEISAIKANETFDFEWVYEYSRRTQKYLVPIGESSRGYMILTMAEDGSVYAGYDDFLIKIADSGEEAIEALCWGSDFEEIP